MKRLGFKRIFAYLLALVMVLGMLPTSAFAAVRQVTVNLTGIGTGQQVLISVAGTSPITATTKSGNNDSVVAISVDEPSGKFLTVTSADGSLVGAATIESSWSNYSANVTMISVADGLPINFFIAKPGSTPSASSDYDKYQPFDISQGSGAISAEAFLDPAVHNEIRNAPMEETITQYVASWPGERSAEEFKNFGEETFFRTTYSSDEYTIRWINICLRGGGYGNCYQCSNSRVVHAHIDGTLTKKVSPANLEIKKTIPAAQSGNEIFTFMLDRLMQDSSMNPTQTVDESFTPIIMTATIPAGATSARVELPAGSQETIGFGYYRIRETSSAKWKSDPVYVQVATDGSLRYSSSYNSGYKTATAQNPVTIANTIQHYTVTYNLNGGVAGDESQSLSYPNLPYGTSTPTIAAPSRTGYTFAGWSTMVNPTPRFEINEPVTGNVTYVAQWAGAAVDYTVKYYKQDLYSPGHYELVDIQTVQGTTDTSVNLAADADIINKYDANGYKLNTTHPGSKLSGVVAADGSLELHAYYDLKTYTVLWLDYDGTVLEKDSDVRHGTRPTYDGSEPTGPDTAAIDYVFKEWIPDNEDTPELTNTTVITGDAVYRADYTSEAVPFVATVYVTLDGEAMDIKQIKEADARLFLKNGTETYPLTETQLGTYVNTAVPSGTYDIIRQATDPATGTDFEYDTHHTLVINSANGVGYLPHYSLTYDLNYESSEEGFNKIAAKEYICGDHAVSIAPVKPVRDGYTFAGWTTTGEGIGTLYKEGDLLTGSLATPYTLYAKWLQDKTVTVTVILEHTNGNEVDNSSSEVLDNVQVQGLLSSMLFDKTSQATEYSYDADANKTTYANVYLGTLKGDQTMSAVVAYKNDYVTESTTVNEDTNGVIHYTITLRFTPANFDLDYTIKMKHGIPAVKNPVSVTVSAKRMVGGEWVDAGVADQFLNIGAAGQVSGTFVVPKGPEGNHHKYRIDIIGYIPTGLYTDTLYIDSALAGDSDGVTYDSGNANLMSGSLLVEISVPTYTVTLDAKEGTLPSGKNTVIEDLYYVPNLAEYMPTKTGNTFGGWYLDSDNNNTYDADTDPMYVGGEELDSDITLHALWQPHRSISGTVTVEGSYQLDGIDHDVNDVDLPGTVTVILERMLSNGQWEAIKTATSDTMNYVDTGTGKQAAYNYEFSDLPNDGTEYRIVMHTANYTHLYDNNNDGSFVENENIPIFDGVVADIDVRLKFSPAGFVLNYQIDASAVGENYRPTNVSTLVLYEAISQAAGVPQLTWNTITQQIVDGEELGEALNLESDGITDGKYDSVWIYRPDGNPYSYAIRLQKITYKTDGSTATEVTEDGGKTLDKNLPFTISYAPVSAYYGGSGQTAVLKATLTPNSYAVTYNLDGGTKGTGNPDSHKWSFDTPVGPDPTKYGFVFAGWDCNVALVDGNDNKKIPGSVAEDVTLTALWKADSNHDGVADENQVKVTFKIVNGSWSSSSADIEDKTELVTVGGTLSAEQIPAGMQATPGYEAGAWGTPAPDTNTAIIEDTSYTYTFSVKSYNISYALDGGAVDGANPTSYTVESDSITLINPTKAGYAFIGWSGTGLTGENNKAVTVAKGSIGDREYTAHWEKVTYTIAYTLDGGRISGTNPVSYDVETPEFTLINPTRTGYDFVGWSGTDLNGEENMTVTIAQGSAGNRSYTAHWQAGTGTKYTVEHYQQNLEDNDYSLFESVELAGTTNETATATSRVGQSGYEGFELNIAHPDARMSGAIAADGSLVLKLYYDRETFTINWVNDNGDVLETDLNVKYGAMAQYNQGVLPYKEADAQYIYTFDGWDKPVVMVTKDVTYKATYSITEQTYNGTVHVILDGTYNSTNHDLVSGTHKTIEAMMGSGTTLYLNRQEVRTEGGATVYVPTDEFFTLTGGCTDGYNHDSTAVCGGYTASGLKNGTYRIYAQKSGEDKPSKLDDQLMVVYGSDRIRYLYFYSVTYEMGYENCPDPVVEYYRTGEDVTIPAENPTREQHLFTGWGHKVGADTTFEPNEIFSAGATPVRAIKAPQIFIAQWKVDKQAAIHLTLEIDHSANGGSDPAPGGIITIEPTYRPVGSIQDYVEVPNYDYAWTDWYDGDPNQDNKTTLHRSNIFTGLSADDVYSVNVILPHYSVDDIEISSQEIDEFNVSYEITVKLKYNPDLFTLNYKVEADASVPEELIPVAVDIKVLSWDANKAHAWAPISRHENNATDVELQDDNNNPIRTAYGSYDVPVHRAADSNYYYRVAVAGFSLRDGTELTATGSDNIRYDSVTNAVVPGGVVPLAIPVYYADGAYYATVEVNNGANAIPGTSLPGAYGRSDGDQLPFYQRGDITVKVYANLCDVTLDLNYDGTDTDTNDDILEVISGQFRMPDLGGKKPARAGFSFAGWYTNPECTDGNEVVADTLLSHDVRVYAKWNPDKTVEGTIKVAKTYLLDDGSHTINAVDRPVEVKVLLQKLDGTTVSEMSVAITYPDASDVGTGSYGFTVPDDGTVYRVYTLSRNFTDTYWNEELAMDAAYTSNHYTAVYGEDNIATVNAHLVYTPANFDLYYSIDAGDIGEDFRPGEVQTFVMYDGDVTAAYQWTLISQMVTNEGEKGQVTTGDTADGVTENFCPVWQYHSAGHAYGYAIRLQSITYKEDGVNVKTVTRASNENFGTSVPFTITYQYPAYYQEHTNMQNTPLVAKLTPRSYDITYVMNADGDTVTGMDQAPTMHTWSKTTSLPTPQRMGYIFKGWSANVTLDINGNIPGAVNEAVTLTAQWEAESYSITYDLAGGAVAGTNPDGYTMESDDITLINPTKSGYIFKGWSGTELSGEGNTTVVIVQGSTGNRSYTAHWEALVPGLNVTKTVDKTIATVGETICWTVIIQNNGETNLSDIVVTDTLYAESTAIGTLDLKDGNTFVSVIDSLAMGDSVTLKATYVVKYADAGKTLMNKVVATVDGIDPVEAVSPATSAVYPQLDPGFVPNVPQLNKQDHIAYIIGYDDGTVCPQRNITRAEVATIFFRLLTEESRAAYWSQSNPYSDVEATAWYNNAISTLANAGIIGGYPDGTFGPDRPITRAEFAAIAARFSEVVYNGGNSFVDVSENHWAVRYIALAEHLGWIGGYPDGSFKPNQNITRAETMTVINRVLERAVEETHMVDNMVRWADNLPGDWYYEAIQEATNSHTYTRTNERVPEQDFNYENWVEILPVTDWAELENAWSTANSK